MDMTKFEFKSRKATKIAVYNNKGGVGKSTFLINLSVALAKKGKSILVVDNDSQANTTMILTGKTEDQVLDEYGVTVYDMMTSDDVSASSCIVRSIFDNIDVIPSCDDHADTAEEIASHMDNSRIMSHKLKEIEDRYDYILIDNAPTRDLNVYNCLFAADVVLSPVETQLFSQKGLANLLKQISKANKKREVPVLHYVFLSKVDNRQEKFNEEVKQHLSDLLGDDFLQEQISLRSQYVKSLAAGVSVLDFTGDKKEYVQKCAEEITNLTDKIIEKINDEM